MRHSVALWRLDGRLGEREDRDRHAARGEGDAVRWRSSEESPANGGVKEPQPDKGGPLVKYRFDYLHVSKTNEQT